MLFNPADLVFLCLDFQKAASVLQHVKPLAVHHFGHAIGHCGHPVMQIHLPRGDIHRLMQLRVKARAPP